MKEFIIACLPFVVMGVAVVIVIVNSKKNKKNYITEGMILGMSFGLMISNCFDGNMGLGLSLGMLIGEAIGSFVKKK